MKRVALIIAVVLILGNFAFADTYIKEVSRTETYSDGKLTSTLQTGQTEMWIGKNKIAYITEPRSFIIDLENNEIFFVNNKEKSYVKTALPLDMSKILSEEIKSEYEARKSTGTVKETEETKKVLGKVCKGYDVKAQQFYRDQVMGKYEFKVWATPDVDFDVKLLKVLLQNMRKFFSRDEKYREELNKIKGVQMRLEMTTEYGSTTVKNVDENVEQCEKDAPAGIYSPPEGYKKKEKLTVSDFEG